MAPTPSSRSNHSTPSSKSTAPSKTPNSKLRLNFTNQNGAVSSEHPVEVIGRIRDHPEQRNKPDFNQSDLQINSDGKSIRVRTEIGYRDFTLDGASLSETDDLDEFYTKFVQSRINGVKLGQKCTVMMYGPTGSGKSHTMFGSSKQQGIVYRSLKDILGGEDVERVGMGTFVQVTVLEIYNEEIYDLLSSGSNGGGFGFGWSKGGSASKMRLEVMGKKAKNATFISGNEADKMLKEIQKVEKRRIVKSTLCNERSSRSHCMIIVDVPTVGGRLMLVDMAGSENIEQAGQTGLEAKMQTGKINQGNIALKRVVESIANGDSHVPFRDSKLTMLLQDSFEDDKSKILMILCASPDQKELHKTIATLEYGAKAKCIIRGPHTPNKDKVADDSSSALILGSRIAALDQFIFKLQTENKVKEKECKEARNELKRKEEEISALKAKLAVAEGRGNERTLMLKTELKMKIEECKKMAEMERRKMEEQIFQQKEEIEMLRRQLKEIDIEPRAGVASSGDIEGSSFMKKMLDVCEDDSDMVKSMDLSKSIDFDTSAFNRGEIYGATNLSEGIWNIPSKACLTTVYEEEEYESEEGDKDKENLFGNEEEKEVIEEKKMIIAPKISAENSENCGSLEETDSCRQTRIENIFTLCGNYREISQPKNVGEMENQKSVSKDDQDLGNFTGCDEKAKDLKENQIDERLPFSSLENKLAKNPLSYLKTNGEDSFSSKVAPQLSSSPFITQMATLSQ